VEIGVSELRGDPDLLEIAQQALDRANTTVSRPEAIKRFRILPGQFEVGAELTPTGKVRRDYVLARYASDIDACTRDQAGTAAFEQRERCRRQVN
jgi:long-chain acyl-CoA synthetase